MKIYKMRHRHGHGQRRRHRHRHTDTHRHRHRRSSSNSSNSSSSSSSTEAEQTQIQTQTQTLTQCKTITSSINRCTPSKNRCEKTLRSATPGKTWKQIWRHYIHAVYKRSVMLCKHPLRARRSRREASSGSGEGALTGAPVADQIPETPKGAMTVVSPALASGMWSVPGSTVWTPQTKAL